MNDHACCTTSTLATDPVCGMTVDPAEAAATSVWEGETVYFCAVACQKRFDAMPEKYGKRAAGRAAHGCCSTH